MILDGQPLFSIRSTEDQTSKWIRLGQTFNEFKAVEFDPVSDTLTMRKVRFQSSKIKDSGPKDRKARLRNSTGLELPYELLRQDDQTLGQLLKQYDELSLRMNQVNQLASAHAQQSGSSAHTSMAMTCLSMKHEELRNQVIKTAAAKS